MRVMGQSAHAESKIVIGYFMHPINEAVKRAAVIAVLNGKVSVH